MNDVTQLLNAASQGNNDAKDKFWEVVYEELRRMGTSKMARERPGHTLQGTAMVGELYLRLQGEKFENRRHFFGTAAEAMRRILVERARRKIADPQAPDTGPGMDPLDVLAVHEALDELAEIKPEVAELVKFHFFAGYSLLECSELLNITDRTARRHWKFAQTWLFKKLGGKAQPLQSEKE